MSTIDERSCKHVYILFLEDRCVVKTIEMKLSSRALVVANCTVGNLVTKMAAHDGLLMAFTATLILSAFLLNGEYLKLVYEHTTKASLNTKYNRHLSIRIV